MAPKVRPLSRYVVELGAEETTGDPGPPGPPGGTGADYAVVYNALEHGIDNTGAVDNTAAYAATYALADSGILYFPPGIYKGNLLHPDTPDDRSSNWHVRGSGINSTYLIPASPDTPALTKGNRTGILEGATFGGFTIMADPSGSTGAAIDLAGFRFCELDTISIKTNGSGNFAALFHLSSGQMKCYRNIIRNILIAGGTVPNTGPTRIFLFDSKDDAGVRQGAGFTANNNVIEGVRCYSNTGISIGIDALHSAGTVVRDCFWEANPGCTYVIPGTGGLYEGNSYEAGVTTDTIKFDVDNTVGDEGLSNNNLFVKEAFSDMTSLTFPSGVQDNKIIDPVLYTSCTFTDNGTNNLVLLGAKVLAGSVVSLHAGSAGDPPAVVSTNLGTGGTCTLLPGSNDCDGIISLNFGTTVPASDGVITMTFDTPYLSNPSVMVCPAQGPGPDFDEWAGAGVVSPIVQVGLIAADQITIIWGNGTVPSDNSILRVNYHVKGLPN